MAINKDYIESSESSTEHVSGDSAIGKKATSKETKREEKSAIKSKIKSISQEPVVNDKIKSISQEPVVNDKIKSISQEPVVNDKVRPEKLPSVSASSSRPQEFSAKDDNHTSNVQKEIESDRSVTESVAEAVEKTVEEVVENVTDLSESKYTNNYEIHTPNPFLSAATFWQTSVMNYLDIYKELSINTIRLTENWFSCFFPKLYPRSRLNQ
jgi:hypothetical protein